MKKLIAILCCSAVLLACKFNAEKKVLPIYGERKAVTRIVNGQKTFDTIYQTIPPIHYINQNGDSISDKNIEGKIHVADFFFTTCPSICPIMQRNMLNVYNAFKADNNIKILSYTIDPQHDSVSVLKKYADKLGITGNSWWLLQGHKDQTYLLAKSYLVSVQEKNPAGEYIHDGYFILIDAKKRIRGSYNGTNPDEVNKLIEDIKALKTEKDSTSAK